MRGWERKARFLEKQPCSHCNPALISTIMEATTLSTSIRAFSLMLAIGTLPEGRIRLACWKSSSKTTIDGKSITIFGNGNRATRLF